MKKTLIILAIIAMAIIIYSAITFLPNGKTEQTNLDMLTDGTEVHVEGTDVAYYGNVQGFYAEPQEAGDYPGVIMIHEWWGLNDNIKKMAEQLADEGYRVLAVDLFGTVASTPDEARAQVQSLDQSEALQNLQAAADYLRNQGATRLASLGWCFGGGQSMQLALAGSDLDATIIYYGNLITDQNRLAEIDWPVLGVFGDQDQSIPVETVRQFEAALDAADVPNEIYIYEGVGHAFANPSGNNYAPEETMDAWEKTLQFLETSLHS